MAEQSASKADLDKKAKIVDQNNDIERNSRQDLDSLPDLQSGSAHNIEKVLINATEPAVSEGLDEKVNLEDLSRPIWITKVIGGRSMFIALVLISIIYATCIGITFGQGLLTPSALDIYDFYPPDDLNV